MRLNDALGLFSDQSYVNPEAPPTDNGLDPNTGWARGVIEDPNSASGYSYKGIPVNTDGSRFEPRQTAPTQYPLEPSYIGSGSLAPVGDIFQRLFNNGMPQAQPTVPLSQFAMGGDFEQPEPEQPLDPYLQMADQSTAAYPAVGAISDFANRVTPQLPTPPPSNQDFIDIDRMVDTTSAPGAGIIPVDPYAQYRDQNGLYNGIVDPYDPRINPNTAREAAVGSAVSGFNPVSELATMGLKKANVPFARPVGEAAGLIADAATFGALSGASGGNTDVKSPGLWGEAGMAAANAGTLGLGGGLAKNLAANVAGNLAFEEIPKGLQKYSETSLPGSDLAGNKGVQLGTGLAGAFLAGAGAYKGTPKNPVNSVIEKGKTVATKFDQGIISLDQLINEPAGSRGVVTAGMGFRTGPDPTGAPPRKVLSAIDDPTDLQFNNRLLFHGTTDYTYKSPDPEHGVYGVTQGPGVYHSADPSKLVDRYGDRLFATEFDGKVMQLADEADPQFWDGVRQQVADRLESIGVTPNRTASTVNTFNENSLTAKRFSAGKTPDNNFGYRDALIEAASDDLYYSNLQAYDDSLKPIMGRFTKTITSGGGKTAVPSAIVQDVLGNAGIDAVGFRSTADGDVLVVINDQSARVVGEIQKTDLKYINDGDSFDDIFNRIKLAKEQPTNAPVTQWTSNNTGLVYHNGELKARIVEEPSSGGFNWRIYDTDGKPLTSEYYSSKEVADRVAKGLTQSPTKSKVKNLITGEEGQSIAPFAARTGAGAVVGGVSAEASGEDWKKGAAIGAITGAALPALTKGAMKLTHGGMGGSVIEEVNEDNVLDVLMNMMNERRKEMGGRTFANVDDMTESLSKPMRDLPPIYPNPKSPTAYNFSLDLPGQPPIRITDNPRAPKLNLSIQKPIKPTFKETVKKNVLNVLNIPLEAKVGGDFSSALRQARPLAYSHPAIWGDAVVKGMKAMDEGQAVKIENTIRSHPDLKTLTEVGTLHLNTLGGSEQLGEGMLGKASQSVATKIKSKVPGKAGSFLSAPASYLPATERNYNITLDWLRLHTGAQLLDDARRAGYEVDQKLVKNITDYINHKTGYGTGFKGTRGLLSIPFLAPRFWLSKFQSEGDMITKFISTPALRKEIATNAAVRLGSLSALSALSAYAGGEAGIFQNPLKGSFGSIGNEDASVDITGGIGTEIRGIGRTVLGKTVTPDNKEIKKSHEELGLRYLRGKASPNAGTLWSLYTGENYNGDPANLKSLSGASTVARDEFLNLFYNDVYKAFKHEYPEAALNEDSFMALINKIKEDPTALGRFAGVSAGSMFGMPAYQEPRDKYSERDKLMQEFGAESWATADRIQRNAYNAQYGKIESDSPEAKENERIKTEQRLINVQEQEKIDIALPPGRDWREAHGDQQIAIATQIQDRAITNPYTPDSPTAQLDKDILEWSNKLTELTPYKGGTDWEALEKWLAQNPTIADSVDKYMADPNKPESATTAKVMEYRKDSKLIRDSGYWELRDKTWDAVNQARPQAGYIPGQSYDDYRNKAIDAVSQALQERGRNKLVADNEAIDLVSDQVPGVKLMDEVFTKQVLIPWIAQHPDAFYAIAKWEYISRPNKAEAAILNAIEAKKRSEVVKPTEIK